MGTPPLLSDPLPSPPQDNEMTRFLRGFALPAVALLVLALGTRAPAVAVVPSDSASSEPSAYATTQAESSS